jgi:hypothetical protein
MTHKGLASEEPLGYLASMQQPDGHIRWEASQEYNGMWMTAQVTPAFTGNPLPIPAVPYEELPSSPPEEPSSSTSDGGVSSTPGSGVIAGGGGDGAPLFSRPQPHSRGHTPGGVRRLGKTPRRAGAAKRRDPPARKAASQSSPTHSSSYHRRGEDTAKKGQGAAGNGTGGGAGGLSQAATAHGGGATNDSGSDTVTGVLLGEPLTAFHEALEGEPGLRGASANGNQSPWPALAVGITAALLALLGAHLERKRPRSVL